MKKKLINLVLITCVFCSCNNNSDVLMPSQGSSLNPTEDFIEINGFLARKPATIPKEIFGQNPFEYNEWFEKEYFMGKNARVTDQKVDWGNISHEQLMALIEKEMKKLPELKGLKFNSEHWKNIKKDFPKLEKEQDLEKNGDAIVSYYSDIIKFNISPEIAKIMQLNSKSRPSSIAEGPDVIPANQWETHLAAHNPIAGLSINIGRNDATTAVVNLFGGIGNTDDHNSNAFKHAVWNAMGVQEMMQRLMSKSNALAKMTQFGTGHEMEVVTCTSCSNQVFTGVSTNKLKILLTWAFDTYTISAQLPKHVQQAMDLHNNMSGRSYMQREATFFNQPSDATIINFFKNYACNYTYVKDVNQILSVYGIYNNDWQALSKTDFNNNVSGQLFRAPNSLDIRRKDNVSTGTLICN